MTAAGIILIKDKKILLQHRTDDAPVLPGYWGFFGGCVEQGETPEEAVRREAFEELGYVLKNPKLILTVERKSGTCYFFAEEYTGAKLELNEGQGMDWFTIEEAKSLKMDSDDLKVLNKLNL